MVAGEAKSKLLQLMMNLTELGMDNISPEGKLKLLVLSKTLFKF